MRALLHPSHVPALPPADLDDTALAELYATPSRTWVRAMFVTTLDGAATGADGRSGSINTPDDSVVFGLVRATADAVLLGAGTARDEGYTPLTVDDRWRAARQAEHDSADIPLVIVSKSAHVPRQVVDGAQPGQVLLVTCAAAPRLRDARHALGAAAVLLCGDDDVDLPAALEQLRERGLARLVTEGGPSLLGALLAHDLVDELCLTLAPRLVGGDQGRIAAGPPIDQGFRPHVLVEQGDTIMGRWLRRRGPLG